MTTIRKVIIIVVAAFLAVFLPVSVSAESIGGGSIQEYEAEAPLNIGTVVQLQSKKSNVVQVATKKNLQNMFGVVVDKNQMQVVVSSGTLKNPTYVTVSGTYNTLVSTENGTIHPGDYVTMSSVDGVAMKAGTKDEQSTVLGRAQAEFDGSKVALGKTTLKDTTGKANKEVVLGSVPVTINIERNPIDKSTKVNAPEWLQQLGKAIAEKEVSALRIYISLGIVTVTLITALLVLYAGVRSSVISIGRNPMSKKSIVRALIQIIFTALIILVTGLFAVYLLLKL